MRYLGIGLVAAGYMALAQAQSVDIVDTRQKALKALGASFKTIRDELRGDSPDAARIKTAATDITSAAAEIGKWFPAGSGPAPGLKTDARPQIWTDAAGFASAREAFIREANKWAQLGANGDRVKWQEAAASLGQTCKGCHDKFRVKRE